MEAYQSEFCEDEFYNILETISPFTTIVNEVEFCPRCKSAPCTCLKVAGFKMTTGMSSNKKRYCHNVCKDHDCLRVISKSTFDSFEVTNKMK